jgi:uncharacterized protein (TIRG00374 family)
VTTDTVRQIASPLIPVLRRYGVVLVVAFLAVFAAVFLVSGRGELAEAGGLLGAVSPVWLLVLAALQMIVLSAAALTYQFMLRRLGYSLRWSHLVGIQLKRIVVATITPLGGPPSLYVFVRSLRQQGVPASDALITATARTIMGLVAFLLILVPALVLQKPSGVIFVAAILLLAALVVLLGLSVYLLRGSELPSDFENRAPKFFVEFIGTARAHRLTAVDFVLPLMFGITSHVATAAMLFTGLQAVGYQASVSTVMIGYVVGKLFFMMAPMFQGVGVVELGMAIALQQAGVPAGAAIGAALLYRVGDLWLPLFCGIIMQIARMQLLRGFAASVSGHMVRLSRLSTEIPARAPVVARPLSTLGHGALGTEAILVAGIGVWVNLGSPLAALF